MATPDPNAHSHSLMHLFKLNQTAEKREPWNVGCSIQGWDALHCQRTRPHTPACVHGFWLHWAFLTETKHLFGLREAQARPCEPGGQRGHNALGAGHPGYSTLAIALSQSLSRPSGSPSCTRGCLQVVQGVPGRELSPIWVQETPFEGDVSCSLAMGSGVGQFPPGVLALWMDPKPVSSWGFPSLPSSEMGHPSQRRQRVPVLALDHK